MAKSHTYKYIVQQYVIWLLFFFVVVVDEFTCRLFNFFLISVKLIFDIYFVKLPQCWIPHEVACKWNRALFFWWWKLSYYYSLWEFYYQCLTWVKYCNYSQFKWAPALCIIPTPGRERFTTPPTTAALPVYLLQRFMHLHSKVGERGKFEGQAGRSDQDGLSHRQNTVCVKLWGKRSPLYREEKPRAVN